MFPKEFTMTAFSSASDRTSSELKRREFLRATAAGLALTGFSGARIGAGAGGAGWAGRGTNLSGHGPHG